MAAWRREFLVRFPALKAEALQAMSVGALMQRPLFFVLKDAIDKGSAEVIERVISYVLWLDEHQVNCATEIEEDLLGPITDSERLAVGLLGALSEDQYNRIEKYLVIGWQSPEQKAAKLQRMRRQFNEQHSLRKGRSAV